MAVSKGGTVVRPGDCSPGYVTDPMLILTSTDLTTSNKFGYFKRYVCYVP